MVEEKGSVDQPEEKTQETTLAEKIEELKKENDRMESNITKLSEMKALDAMGGKTTSEPQVEVKEDTPEEYIESNERRDR